MKNIFLAVCAILLGKNFHLLRMKQSEQFGPWDEKFSAQRPTDFEFASLDEAIDAEIIHSQQSCGLLQGVSQSFGGNGVFPSF